MKEIQWLLWDLDGTLTDPMLGITSAVQYALRSFQIEEPDRQILTPFIGPPLKDSFRQYYGFSEEQASLAVAKYREYFSNTGIYENQVYPGIPSLLKDLRQRGKTLVLATSKPTVFAARILKHFHLDDCFAFIAGSELDGTRTHKAEVIAYALDQTNCPVPSDALMIGDRCYDIDGARAVGLQAIGVAYGYGSREELQKAGAAAIADTVEQLREWLL